MEKQLMKIQEGRERRRREMMEMQEQINKKMDMFYEKLNKIIENL